MVYACIFQLLLSNAQLFEYNSEASSFDGGIAIILKPSFTKKPPPRPKGGANCVEILPGGREH